MHKLLKNIRIKILTCSGVSKVSKSGITEQYNVFQQDVRADNRCLFNLFLTLTAIICISSKRISSCHNAIMDSANPCFSKEIS